MLALGRARASLTRVFALALLFALALASLSVSAEETLGAPVSVTVQSCAGCRLNSMPSLKHVLHEEAKHMDNVNVEWIRGHFPTAQLKDAEGRVVRTERLRDLDRLAFLAQLQRWGLRVRQSGVELPSVVPVASGQFRGHWYEFMDAPRSLAEARELSYTYRSPQALTAGRLADPQEPEEAAFVRKLLGRAAEALPEARGWLAVERAEQGFRFTEGPLKGHPVTLSAFADEQEADGEGKKDCVVATPLGWKEVSCEARAGVLLKFVHSSPEHSDL